MNAPKKIINAVKSITAKEIFRLHPEVKQLLWGGKFWTSGYYVNTVGQYANEEIVKNTFRIRGSQNTLSWTEISSNYFDTPTALPRGSSLCAVHGNYLSGESPLWGFVIANH